MRVTLVRHGEVDEKYLGKYNGHNDIALSKKGKEQAKELAQHFASTLFDRVYCSDLRRARETLQPFKQRKGAIYTKELREKSWGRHEGLSFDEICRLENLKYKSFGQWVDALDGERQDAYIQRIETFFKKEIFSKDDKDILLITHAGVIRTFIAMVKSISFEKSFEFKIPYASYIKYDDGIIMLQSFD